MSGSCLAQIVLFAGTYAPRNWMFCQGQSLSIQQNTALFSILGITYGGNGSTNFNLPDLRGRVAVHQGQGPGLSNYTLGQTAGVEGVQLNTQQMPAHNHMVAASTSGQTTSVAMNNYLGGLRSGPVSVYQPDINSSTTLNNGTISNTGGNGTHENRQPLLALNYIICINGIFPVRN